MTTKPATLAEQLPTVKMLLDGKFIESATSEWHDVVNPATQAVLAQVPFATDAEIDAAVSDFQSGRFGRLPQAAGSPPAH